MCTPRRPVQTLGYGPHSCMPPPKVHASVDPTALTAACPHTCAHSSSMPSHMWAQQQHALTHVRTAAALTAACPHTCAHVPPRCVQVQAPALIAACLHVLVPPPGAGCCARPLTCAPVQTPTLTPSRPHLCACPPQVLAAAHNLTHTSCNPVAHAEMRCIMHTAEQRQAWRLLDATLYVTLEPCPMCECRTVPMCERRAVPLYVTLEPCPVCEYRAVPMCQYRAVPLYVTLEPCPVCEYRAVPMCQYRAVPLYVTLEPCHCTSL